MKFWLWGIKILEMRSEFPFVQRRNREEEEEEEEWVVRERERYGEIGRVRELNK